MAPKTSGNTLADLLREAGAAARTGDLSEAERLYRKVLDRSPANVEAMMGLGTVLPEPGQKAEYFQRVLEIDPDNAEAAASLARLQAVLPSGPAPMKCAFHPQVDTVLRCSQCGRPICVRCARPYPVGQLCPICVRGRVPLYYQPGMVELAGAGAAALVASAVAGFLASLVIGWGLILALLGGTLVGSGLSRLVLWAGQRRRGLKMQVVVGACVVAGSLLGGGLPSLSSPYHSIFFLLYVAVAVGSTVAWLR